VPVESTIETIRFELLAISLALILISLVMAYFLSRIISKPIIKLNQASKKIPEGIFETEGVTGYQEVEELSETLRLAAQEISRADTLRRELVANVSHDLRTPLTLIASYSEAMRDLPGENSPENLQVIIDETKRLSELVSDLLNLSKLEAGIDEVSFEELDLVSLVSQIIERYRKMTILQGYDIHFETNCDCAVVDADRIKLTQAIYNLINNAINYCGEDKYVLVHLEKCEGRIRFEVHDHGDGIPNDKLLDIWDRYYRVDVNHNTAKIGTGLGLSIVKKILDMHHAWFGVESKLGAGSCFWFVLPLK
jgi:signal transduction histidine kinase